MGQYLNVVIDWGKDRWVSTSMLLLTGVWTGGVSTSMLLLTGVWAGGSVPQCCC